MIINSLGAEIVVPVKLLHIESNKEETVALLEMDGKTIEISNFRYTNMKIYIHLHPKIGTNE